VNLKDCRLGLPRKSDSNVIFAGSVLVSGREQRPLLPEPRVRKPEQSLSILNSIQTEILYCERNLFAVPITARCVRNVVAFWSVIHLSVIPILFA
jgi:hypothetical protein